MNSVVITGASTGIGRAIALDLASAGWRVFAGVRRAEDGEALQQEGSSIQPVLLDVVDEDSIRAAVAQVREELGTDSLTALVNNAGVVLAGPLEYLPVHAFQTQIDVNLTGAFRTTQAFLPLLRQAAQDPNASPRVIMISSISGRVGTPMAGGYNASKFAMEGMSDAWRRELLPHGIDVILVEPGAIATPIWKKSKRASEAIRHEFGADCERHYGKLIAAMEAEIVRTEKRAIPAQKVADVVRNALLNRRPRSRYLVGRDARMGAWLQTLLPTRWLDRLIVREYSK